MQNKMLISLIEKTLNKIAYFCHPATVISGNNLKTPLQQIVEF